MIPCRLQRNVRQGVARRLAGTTLIELLVVIGIMLLLAALTIPLVKPLLDGQTTREGSRVLNAAFAMAKARASELQRPVGLFFDRGVEGKDACLQVFLAESPLPYCGDTTTARVVSITPVGGLTADATFDAQSASIAAPVDPMATLAPPPIINPGDQIRFNYQGPYYDIVAIDRTNVNAPVIRFRHRTAPLPAAVTGVPYQIVRAPRATLRHLNMPKGVAIDLSASGSEATGIEFGSATAGPGTPLVVMFTPSGNIDRVIAGGSIQHPIGSLHFLVGRDDQVNSSNIVDPEANLADMANVWVSVGIRNGLVTSSANVDNSAATTNLERIQFAREFAIRSLTLGSD
ncbi:pilus assembly FimT family protein [Lignipirellula cremea]|uniref:Prepilin-type N-terminal cleavage/methylation domain-containing protein n=1 Tax=Lignipirellula cremea TaxID=2528010 RepID=A0A518DMH4_9BACT|nr:hypothetical protein [Lignipirellula cremea]QDU93037.1 hypothetical protein Pla8534_08120 [Lignipirellula cremea]